MFSRSIYKYRVHTMTLGLYRKETRVEMWLYQKKRLQLYSQTDWYLPLSLIIEIRNKQTMEYLNIHVTAINMINVI